MKATSLLVRSPPWPLAEDLAFTDAEKDQIQKGAQAMVLASRVWVDTLAAYVKVLGGGLKIVADFGDETCVLG